MQLRRRLRKQNLLAMAVFAAALATTGCTTSRTMSETAPPAGGTEVEPGADHVRRIDKFSAGNSEYSGFYNNFEFKATLLNSPIRSSLLSKEGSYYQWDDEKKNLERERSNQEMSSETTIFMSFFTPDRKNDNLTDQRSIWRVYLDVGGRRYLGKVKRSRSLLAELQVLYPYHTRWNSPYFVSFPVPTTAVETQEATLTITGPLGTRGVKFAAVQ